MRLAKQILQPSSILLFILILWIACSCEKEYSYEGGYMPPPVVVIPADTTATDTVTTDPGALENCSFCNGITDPAPGTWIFKTGAASLCGEVDTAFVLNLERSTFTFFGPSFCGSDSGLVFTITLGGTGLTQDIENLVATNAVFYYYHTGRPYILLSHADQPFHFVITHYSHATRIAAGSFSGTGFRVDGRAVNVTDGKFNFQIR